MENKELINLENAKNELTNQLDSLVFGSIRTKNENGTQNIYVRRNKYGEKKFELVGEFTRQNYDMILYNCKKAKLIRTKIRELDKKIKEIKNQSNP